MEFTVPETGAVVAARQRPIVIITSNNEKEMPDAFLRRCVFHWIEFPDKALMARIVRVHHPDVEDKLLAGALGAFYTPAGGRGPAQAAEHQRAHRLAVGAAACRGSSRRSCSVRAKIPFLGTLLKKEQDIDNVGRRLKAR